MNKEFPKRITLLRKEKGISQKKASNDLNISQALLSHYEKGIRECGLCFVVKVAEYYNVSCDYLLGRSADRTGNTILIKDILVENDNDNLDLQENEIHGNIITTLNKKLILNSLNILFDLIGKTDNKNFISEICDFFMLSVYRMFRIVYSVSSKNQQHLFDVPKSMYNVKSASKMLLCEMNLKAISEGEKLDNMESIKNTDVFTLNSETLIREYPLFASSLFNLIKNAEDILKKFD